jgi:hypothetical protein
MNHCHMHRHMGQHERMGDHARWINATAFKEVTGASKVMWELPEWHPGSLLARANQPSPRARPADG